MDKFAVVAIKNKKIIGHFLLGKTGGVSKTVFYFLRWECNDCQEKIGDGKAVNLGDGMGMRVSFLFCRQNQCIDILSIELDEMKKYTMF